MLILRPPGLESLFRVDLPTHLSGWKLLTIHFNTYLYFSDRNPTAKSMLKFIFE